MVMMDAAKWGLGFVGATKYGYLQLTGSQRRPHEAQHSPRCKTARIKFMVLKARLSDTLEQEFVLSNACAYETAIHRQQYLTARTY